MLLILKGKVFLEMLLPLPQAGRLGLHVVVHVSVTCLLIVGPTVLCLVFTGRKTMTQSSCNFVCFVHFYMLYC